MENGNWQTDRISVIVLTYNEEIHLEACLGALGWCSDVVVVDSYSTDNSKVIAERYGARWFQNRFAGFGAQRNWAIENVPDLREWVLFLDADERVPPELASEMNEAVASAPRCVGAYRMRRRFHLWGRWLPRSSQYPTWVVRLVRRDRAIYVDRGHAETQEIEGEVLELTQDLIDENLAGIEEWFARQNRYSTREAQYEDSLGHVSLGRCILRILFASDPMARRASGKQLLGRVPGRAILFFCYVYVARGGFLEGRDGLTLSVMRAMYHQMISIKRYDSSRRSVATPRNAAASDHD